MTKLISQLNSGTARQPTSGAKFEYEESGTSYPATLAQMQAALAGSSRGCVAYKAANQTALNLTTATAITWESETFDTDSCHSTTANTSRMTVPSGVTKVRLRACLWFANLAADNWVQCYFTKNGLTFVGGSGQEIYNAPTNLLANPLTSFASSTLVVTAGDYFEVMAQVRADTSVDINAAISFFEMEIVA